MQHLIRCWLAAALCVLACWPAWPAVEMDGIVLEDCVQVGGKSLKLNGAGISMRLMFKVYAMGLYLPAQRATPQDVLATDGPRRLSITMLRNVRSEDFQRGLTSYVSAEGAALPEAAAAGILHLSRARRFAHPGLVTRHRHGGGAQQAPGVRPAARHCGLQRAAQYLAGRAAGRSDPEGQTPGPRHGDAGGMELLIRVL